MRIYFKTSAAGEAFSLEVNIQMTVVDLKKAIREKASIEKCVCFAPFLGEQNLASDPKRTASTLLSDCGIKDGTTLAVKFKCRNHGCQQYFDPTRVHETRCVHHKNPPVIWDNNRFWRCCPGVKAANFDELMKIPGCQIGHCSMEEQGRVQGGTDMREEMQNANAPRRIDVKTPIEDIPLAPRKQLEKCKAGLSAIGVDENDFELAWVCLAAKHGGDMNAVVQKFRKAMAEALASMPVEQ